MKKVLFIFATVISFWTSAQDSTQIKKAVLTHKLHQCFSDNWKVELIDTAIILKRDSLFLPSHFLLRANLFLADSTKPVIVYFFEAWPKDSVLLHYFKNSFIKAFRDTGDSEAVDEYESQNSNHEYIAFSFCSYEKLCQHVNEKFTNDMGLLMPKMEIKIVDIKQEEKHIEPPPPPPPQIKPPKNKQRKKE